MSITILFEIAVTDAQLSVYSTREINQQVSGLCRASVKVDSDQSWWVLTLIFFKIVEMILPIK